jgi:hypothetical protein
VGAVLSFGLADWYFIPPLHRLSVARAGDTVALISFLVVAAIVSALVDRGPARDRGLTAIISLPLADEERTGLPAEATGALPTGPAPGT